MFCRQKYFPIVAVLALASCVTPPAGDQTFHPPLTAAEKALSKILKKQDQNIRTSSDFSHGLIQSWRNAEQKLIRDQCGGVLREGELCGFDYNVVTCAQDAPEYYLFKTKSTTGVSATISVTWPYHTDDRDFESIYKLVKNKNGSWIVDAIICSDGEHFNIEN